MLNKYQTRAEIIENYDRREIKVRVAGNRPKDLLAIVTYELDKIHRSYERLQYQTLVPCNCSECTGSENPHTYPLDNLRRRLEKGRYQIECEKSFEMVDVRRLIDDVNLSPQQQERKFIALDSPLQQQLEDERQESFHNQPGKENPKPMNYQDVQILVDRNNHIRASSDQGSDVHGELRLDTNKINLTLKLIELEETNSELLKALGNELYQALFPYDINALFHQTMAGFQAVRLRLIFESPELAALSWEFLYDKGTNTFLANNTQTVLSRYIDVPLAKRDIKAASSPLKVLLVISSPTNLATRPLAKVFS